MGQINTIYCKKNKPQEYYDAQFEMWKQDLLSNPGYCEAIFSITYENPKYYVQGSAFFERKNGEPIGFKIYKKSQGKFPYYSVDEVTDEECSICNDKLQSKNNKKYIKLECGHAFHEKCFTKWVHTKWAEGRSPNCPVCRYEPPNDDSEIARLKQKTNEIFETNSYTSYHTD